MHAGQVLCHLPPPPALTVGGQCLGAGPPPSGADVGCLHTSLWMQVDGV